MHLPAARTGSCISLFSGKGILGKSSKYAELQQAEGLNAPDVTVAVLRGSTSQEFAEKLMPKAKLKKLQRKWLSGGSWIDELP